MSSELLKMMEEAAESVEKMIDAIPQEQRTKEIEDLLAQLRENLETARISELKMEEALKKLED